MNRCLHLPYNKLLFDKKYHPSHQKGVFVSICYIVIRVILQSSALAVNQSIFSNSTKATGLPYFLYLPYLDLLHLGCLPRYW